MREIKFRSWAKAEKKYYYLEEKISAFMLNAWCDSEDEDGFLEQFTGLHDKNGKEIYDGDILHGREEGDVETTAWTDVYFQIIYDEKIAGFIARETKITNSSWDEQICELNTEYEVIGNIHENPELVK